MGKMVKNLFGGGAKAQAKSAAETNAAKEQQTVALERQKQEQAAQSAATEASLGKARRTPRGRRLLVSDENSRLG